MSGLDDFLENLKNSPFGRALSERELEQRAEQYRVFIKPLFDKLESIEANTKQTLSNVSSLDPIIIPGNPAPTNFAFESKSGFLYYAGLGAGSFPPAFLDFRYSTYIRFSTTGVRIPVKPGSIIPIPNSPRTVYFTCVTPNLTGNNHFLFNLEKASDFVDPLASIPFVDPTVGFIARASLDPNNLDQYVLFRNIPTVNVGTLPTPVEIRVSDGNGTSLADVVDLSNDNISTSILTLATLAGLYLFDGTNWDRARGDTTNGLDVDVTRVSGTVTVAGTVTGNAAAAAAGGYSPNFQSALSTTVQSVKAGAGKLGGWYIYNPNASVAYVQIFNVASGSVTLGTTTPTLSLGIPASSAANLMNGEGIDFSTAISIAATTTATGSTAPGTGLVTNFLYK